MCQNIGTAHVRIERETAAVQRECKVLAHTLTQTHTHTFTHAHRIATARKMNVLYRPCVYRIVCVQLCSRVQVFFFVRRTVVGG